MNILRSKWYVCERTIFTPQRWEILEDAGPFNRERQADAYIATNISWLHKENYMSFKGQYILDKFVTFGLDT
jgi:hypothetical protein